MAATQKLSDEALRDYLKRGMTQNEIARLVGMSASAVSQRAARLERNGVSRTPEAVAIAHASLWDTKAAAEENYRRALGNYLIAEDKTKAIAEIRNHIKLGMDVLAVLYSLEEVKAFQEEVLALFDEFDPQLRERLLARIRERRTVRAAFDGVK